MSVNSEGLDQGNPPQSGTGVVPADGRTPELKIVLTRREQMTGTGDLRATLDRSPGVWGNGKSQYEAIGNLVTSHPDRFGVLIEVEAHGSA